GQQLPGDNRRCPADEDEEGRLKSILGVVVVAQNAATDAPDHRAMPPHQGRKSRLIATADVVLQQLPIGQSRPIPQHHATKVLEDLARLAGRHVLSFVGRWSPAILLLPAQKEFDPRLSEMGQPWVERARRASNPTGLMPAGLEARRGQSGLRLGVAEVARLPW